MSTKPIHKVITGAVVATIAAAAVLTFTRGESPFPGTASATLPGFSDTNGPTFDGSTATPSSPASADAAERAAESPDTNGPSQSPRGAQTGGGTITATSPRADDADPTQSPPSPSPTPTQPSPSGLGGLLDALFEGGGS